jgi:hypothetical protein
MVRSMLVSVVFAALLGLSACVDASQVTPAANGQPARVTFGATETIGGLFGTSENFEKGLRKLALKHCPAGYSEVSRRRAESIYSGMARYTQYYITVTCH